MERIPNEWFNTFDSYESNWNFSKSTKYTYAKNENGDAWNVILMHITTPSVPLLSFLHCDKKKMKFVHVSSASEIGSKLKNKFAILFFIWRIYIHRLKGSKEKGWISYCDMQKILVRTFRWVLFSKFFFRWRNYRLNFYEILCGMYIKLCFLFIFYRIVNERVEDMCRTDSILCVCAFA